MCKKQSPKQGLSRRQVLKNTGKAAIGAAVLPTLFGKGWEKRAEAAASGPLLHLTVYLSAGARLGYTFLMRDLAGSTLPASAYGNSGMNPALLTATGGILTNWNVPILNTGNPGSLFSSTGAPTSAVANAGIELPGVINSMGTSFNEANPTNGAVTAVALTGGIMPSVAGMFAGNNNANTLTAATLKAAGLTSAVIPNTVQGVSFAATHNNDDGKAVTGGQLVAYYMNTMIQPYRYKYITGPSMNGQTFASEAGYTAAAISGVTDYQALQGPNGPLAVLSNTQRGALMTLSQTLSGNQAGLIGGMVGGTGLATAINSGYSAATTNLGANAVIPSPFTDPRLAPFFSTTQTTPANTPAMTQVAASLVKMALDGQLCVGALTAPTSFDQHAVNTGQGYVDNMNVFRSVIVPTLQVAVAQGMKVWIDIATDGSASVPGAVMENLVSSTTTVNNQVGADDSGLSQEISFCYDPKNATPLNTSQVNGYDNNGNVLTGSANPLQAAIGTANVNCAAVRAASALNFFGLGDLTGTAAPLAVAKGFLVSNG